MSSTRRIYDNILFDLDGTLTDSAGGVTRAVQYALGRFGVKADLPGLKTFIGPPLQSSFREVYGFGPDEVQQAVEYFRNYYREKGIYDNRLYPGVTSMLEKLAGKGHRLFLATAKITEFAVKILCYFEIEHYFTMVAGANPDGTRVGKYDLIDYVFAKNRGLEKNRSVMVGDRDLDVSGARSFGIDAVAVTYGYGTVEELSRAAPTYCADSVSTLSNILLEGH